MWDLNDEPPSEASFPLENISFADLTSAPITPIDNENYAMVLENPSTDDFADPLRSNDECLDPSNIPISRPQTRSIDPRLDICALRKEGSPPLNVPSNLRLEDVQRVPGFVPVFRGMSDSCIVYSDGLLPFGVCSSSQPEDSLYSREERFWGLLTWQLTYCTLGKFFHVFSWSSSFAFGGWLARAWFYQPLRLEIELTATQRHQEYLRVEAPPNITAAVTGSRVKAQIKPITACHWISWFFSVPTSNDNRHRFRSDRTRRQLWRKKHLEVLRCCKAVQSKKPRLANAR